MCSVCTKKHSDINTQAKKVHVSCFFFFLSEKVIISQSDSDSSFLLVSQHPAGNQPVSGINRREEGPLNRLSNLRCRAFRISYFISLLFMFLPIKPSYYGDIYSQQHTVCLAF